MFDKHSRILLKIVTGEKLIEEENTTLLKEFNTCLRKASENRVEFLFLKTIKNRYSNIFNELNLDGIYKNGERKIYDFGKTISLFQKELNGSNYAIIKTYYPFPAITSDIDILFFGKTEYERFVETMEERGFSYKKDDNLKGSLGKSGFIKCEPHLDISWYGMRFVSKDFIKRNLVKKKVGQSTFFVPNSKATFLISAAHILFDCQYLSIRDYLVLEKAIVDKKIIGDCLREAERFGWQSAAEYLIRTLRSTEQLSFPFWIPIVKLYGFYIAKLIFDLKEKKENHFSFKNILLPFVYYYWKRLRSKFSSRIYRNSWLY